MLGPILVAASLSIAGVDLNPDDNLRRLGQLIIGVAVGLNMTAPALIELLQWSPIMVGSALFSVLVAAMAGIFLARYAAIDQRTAFFACLPGGLAEMGNIGGRLGADPEPIAIVHTLRVTLIVLIIPPTLLALGSPNFTSLQSAGNISAPLAAILITGGAAGAALLRIARLNNPFMIGAIVFAAAAASSGFVSGGLHPGVFAAGQLLVGFAVGCRFRQEMLSRLPRVTMAAVMVVMVLMLIMAGFGVVLAEFSGFTYPAAILATSSGGLSEMATTAQVLHLAVPLVVGFQVTRGVLVNGFASYYYKLFVSFGFYRENE
jgi:membrane AbrB-like protein